MGAKPACPPALWYAQLAVASLCAGGFLGARLTERAADLELRASRAEAELRELREKVATLEEGQEAQRRQLQEGPACQSSDEVNFAAIRAATAVSEAFGNFSANVQPGLLASKEAFDSF